MSDELEHIGTPKHSGRYPWGSGDNPQQRNRKFLGYVDELKKKGFTELQIAEGLGINTTQLRAQKAIAKNEHRKAQSIEAIRLKDKGMSNVAIGTQMGLNESSVRALLDPEIQARNDVLVNVADMLKETLKEKRFLDVGEGVENHIGISNTKLKVAVAMLQEEGYKVDYVNVQQVGTGKFTKLKVLHDGTATYSELLKNQDAIGTIGARSDDRGRTFSGLGLLPPLAVKLNRVAVRYAEDGGSDADGVIYLRPGVKDISLGDRKYAQVRIQVGDGHYLKGMAMYKENMPDGIDLEFNTNKKSTGNKLDAMKKLKDDADNPFGSIVRQKTEFNSKGEEKVVSALNLVNEEGNWSSWSSKLSSQMLSKQSPVLAKEQLGLRYDTKKADLDEILTLTNPAVRRKLLETFADDADSSAVHLKAAGLPRTSTHVILPINSLKDTEIYAPNYRNGEKVVLIRHPHGGTFEIPELTVNNRNKEANGIIKQAKDAVGINAKVASRLSGADFDGDTVLVIPNKQSGPTRVKTSPPLEALKDFDPQSAYPAYEGMKKMSGADKQNKMGDASNLITDMTIRKASHSEIARAVKYSMVVIDAEKHNLNHKQARTDYGIAELKAKYQGGARSGASTLISRSSSTIRVAERKDRSAAKGGPIDPLTGKRMYELTNESYIDAKGNTVVRKIKTTKMFETDDAHTLSSGTPMEDVYANHANRLKALANDARKSAVSTKSIPYSPSAKGVYKKEVNELDSALNLALKNKPLERQAQLFANTLVSAKRQANPDLEAADIKKIKGQALMEARIRTGAKKQQIEITPRQWEAIQAGAITNNKLTRILANTDLDHVRKLATPRENTVMNTAKMARARNMLAAGYTQSEVADALGVPTSTLNSSLE